MTTDLCQFPPGPKGGLRFTIASFADPMRLKHKLAAQYGDLFTTHTPLGPIIQATDPQNIRAILTADSDNFDVFAKDFIAPFMGPSSILISSGSPHARARKLLMPPFHGARMRAYGETIRTVTKEKLATWELGKPFAAERAMAAISLEVIIRTVFGIDDKDAIATFGRLTRQYIDAFHPLLTFFKFLRRNFLGLGPWARLQRRRLQVDAFLDAEIERCKQNPSGREDILSLLVAARYEDGQPMSNDEIRDQLLTLLFAGHETTAIALSWAIYRLYQCDEIRKRVLDEIQAAGPDPTPEALARLPYLEAVCHETLRLHPVTPGIARQLIRPFTLAGYHLPAGATLAIDIYLLHQRPDLYPEPQSFKPERFLDRTFTPFEYMPFGGGFRRCIGAAFALYEMKLVLATLLPLAELSLVHRRELKTVPRNFVFGPEGGVPVVLQRRLPSQTSPPV